uniref:BZIP domain-containing protein n=1 Tax=Cyclopterus lumpus TaxID=8103 RepID=A0A8C2WID6_CYCLU
RGRFLLEKPGGRHSKAVTGEETKTGNSGNLIAYKLCNTSSTLPQEVAKADAHSSLVSVEASLKREQRLMKNREAVRESRVKKKEYIKCLEDRMYLLENINKTLTREIKALKDTHAQNTPCPCCK